MNLIKCYQTNSSWYKSAVKNGVPVGVLWHDTGAGNAYLKRYVQPTDGAADYDAMIKLIGKNQYGNDWNHTSGSSGVNAWIGKLADGSIATIQAGEWNLHPWGCGSGAKGSCNGYIVNGSKKEWLKPFWLQFEICDDGYKNKDYFLKAYKEAIEFTAYICKEFKIDPFGTYEFNGVSVPTILCHKDAHELKLGSNHGDVYGWFDNYGYSMEDVRNDVAKLLNGDESKNNVIEIKKPQTVDELKEAIDILIDAAANNFKK